MWALAPLAARAACPDAASAGLAAEGVVVALDVTPAGDVVRIVRLDAVAKGAVASGHVAVVGPGSGPAPGDVVALLGTPDAAGVLPGCAFGPAGHLEALNAVAAARPETAVAIPGVPPPEARVPRPAEWPPETGRRAVVVRLGEARADATGPAHPGGGRAVLLPLPVAEARADAVRVVWDDGPVAILVWVLPEDLDVRVVREALLGGTPLTVFPGARARPAARGWLVETDGVTAIGELPEDALGVVWMPAPPVPAGTWSLAAPAVLRDDAGAEVARLEPAPDLAFGRAGGRRAGPDGRERRVRLTGEAIAGVGWVAEAALSTGAGIWGTGRGSGSGPVAGEVVRLLPGLVLTATDAPVALARVDEPVDVALLARAGDHVWVRLETPWGPFGARAACAAAEGPCAPAPSGP